MCFIGRQNKPCKDIKLKRYYNFLFLEKATFSCLRLCGVAIFRFSNELLYSASDCSMALDEFLSILKKINLFVWHIYFKLFTVPRYLSVSWKVSESTTTGHYCLTPVWPILLTCLVYCVNPSFFHKHWFQKSSYNLHMLKDLTRLWQKPEKQNSTVSSAT